MNSLINGRYALLTPVASGATSEVYLAEDVRLARQVALKMLSPDHARRDRAIERFRHEAQLAAALSHPNIVAVYDWGVTDTSAFLVMQYIDGSDLRQVLRDRGRLAEPDALRLAADIAAGLAVAHRHGIVHRDVKPRNVLVARDGAALLTDFGIAASANTSLDEDGGVYGTALYVAPEQVQGLAVDGRADLYALGVLLYEALCGRPPFRGTTTAEVARQHVVAAVTPPRAIAPDVSEEAEAIVLRALEKDPARRFASADTMREALLTACETRAVDEPTEHIQPIPPPTPTPTSGQTHMLPLGDTRATDTANTADTADTADADRHRGSRDTAAAQVRTAVVAATAGAPASDDRAARRQHGDEPGHGPPSASRAGQARQNAPGHGVAETGRGLRLPTLARHGLTLARPRDRQDDRGPRGPEPGARRARRGLILLAPVAVLVAVLAIAVPTLATTRQVSVPDVTGRGVGEAEAALKAAGLTMTTEEDSTQDTPAGLIVSQNPRPSDRSGNGSSVHVVVSRGIDVPDVTGEQCAQARSRLAEAGWTVKPVRWRVANVSDFGKIVAQDPPAGQAVDNKGQITVQVAGPVRPC